jgi:hypothetical protein
VFRWTGQTINAGQTNATAMRNYRAAMSIMTQDFRGIAPDSPVFVIYSTRIPRPLSEAEFVRVRSGYVSPLPYTANETYHSLVNGRYFYFDNKLQFDYRYPRIHRADIVRFFSRGLFRRQTANEGFFTSTTTSSEAFITYGHVNYWRYDYPERVMWDLPEGHTSWSPAYLASDWTLGRSVVLLKDKAALPKDMNGLPETHISRESDVSPTPYPLPGNYVPWPWWYPDPWNPTNWRPTFNLSPLCFGSPASSPSNSLLSPDRIQASRYDIADTTIDGYRQIVATAQARQTLFPLPAAGNYSQQVRIVRWWHPLVFMGQDWIGGAGPDPELGGGGHPRFIWDGTNKVYIVTNPPQYYSGLLFDGPVNRKWGGSEEAIDPWRFGCNRNIVNPLTSTKAANAVPNFLQYCSQFGVEYAGDFLTQDASGIVTKAEPDGVIDFLVRTVGGTAVRETRWYGMPRDIDSDGIIKGWQSGRTAQDMLDVVPLRDVVRTAPGCNTPPADPENPGNNYYYGMPHEKDVEGLFSPPQADYGMFTLPWWDSAVVRLLSGRYVCVWTNDVPAMIRIWIQVDDPSDRAQVGKRLELVFKLK